MISEENVQRVAKALYPIALLLVLVPVVDLMLRTFPPQFGTLQWRFATVGLLQGSIGTILLGLGLWAFTAAIAGHRRTLRAVGFVGLALGVVLIATLVLFALDAIQIRRLANANFRRAILLSSVGAGVSAVLGSFAALTLGRGALAGSRPKRLPAQRRTKVASPIVIAEQPGSTGPA